MKKQGKWSRRLIALVLIVSLRLGMTDSAMAQKTKEPAEGELCWSEETGVDGSEIEAEKETEEEAGYDDAQSVRVFIVMQGESALEAGFSTKGIGSNEDAQDFSVETEEEQELVVDRIQRAIGNRSFTMRYQFSLLTNAVSATVQYGDIEKIKAVEGVEKVYLVPRHYLQDTAKPDTITAGDMVGSYQTWDSGYTGMGQRIAIIDTGIDVGHPSFDAAAFAYGREQTEKETGYGVPEEELLNTKDIENVLDQLKVSQRQENLSSGDLFLNDKIAFAYNYVDRNLDVSHANTDEGDHGTHVAGIAAANQYVPKENGSYQKQPEGVVGIAKDAQLLVMKVFGENGGAYTDDYMAAIEDALLLEADVVNLSLGTTNPGESKAYSGEEYVNEILERLVGSDLVVSISAGNYGMWADYSNVYHSRTEDVNMDTIGTPGSYTNALTVASAINAGYSGYGFQLGKQTMFYREPEADTKIPSMTTLDTTGKGTEYEYVFLESFGEVKDYEKLDVKGKIVFVSKGVISYEEKHENAQKAGAAGLFIYNDTMGYAGMSLSGSKADIPCAMLSWEDSWTLQYQEEKVIRILSEKLDDRKAAEGYRMSSFSSWGVPGDLALKPEITAPGENIYSTLEGGNYGCMSGTSMAAPSIAGMSALVSEYIKRNDLEKKTGLSVRTLTQSLMMSTAVPLKEDDGEEYSPRKQGSGLANVKAAVTTPVYILVGDKNGNDGKVKAELGDDPTRSGNYEFTFTLYNTSGKNQYYTLDSSILTEQVLEEKWIQGSSHALQPQVTYTSDNQVFMYDLNGDQKVDKKDAAELLKYVNGSRKQKRVDCNQEKFDFNQDGVINTVDVYRFLKELKQEQTAEKFKEKTLEVEKQAEVSVKIVLSEADREYLDSWFGNGMYIDGFVYLNGTVDLSLPMLAFYGNWTESSMFDPFDYLTYCNGGKETVSMPYAGDEMTNYLDYYGAKEESEYRYASNMYLEGGDEVYLPERNAFSNQSGNRISGVVYTLIRNAAWVKASIINEKTGEVYYEYQEEQVAGSYYDGNLGGWNNQKTYMLLNWEGTDAQANPLPENTSVCITVKAVPEYYKDRPENAAQGSEFCVPMVIDNTAPKLSNMEDTDDGKIQLTIKDNRYTAAVKVYDRDKETLLQAYSVNQTQAKASTKITIDDPKQVFYLKVIDYAGNETSYRVNRSQTPDTPYTTGVTLDQTSMKLIKGNSKRLRAVVEPESVLDNTVTFRSENEKIAVVDEKGNVTGVAPGATRIIVTTNAKNAAGKQEQAECQVTVEEIAVSLNAVVWGAEGSANFGNINTAKLPEYTKLSKELEHYYVAAVSTGDKIIAAVRSEEGEAESVDIYQVDPSQGYKGVKMGTVSWCSDMAYSPDTGKVFGLNGMELHWFDSKDVTNQGFAYLYDMTDGENLAGITYAGSSDGGTYGAVEWFYAVSQTGELYQIGYVIQSEEILYADLGSTGISSKEENNYNSLYYDKASGYIFWCLYDGGDRAKLYAMEATCDETGKNSQVTTNYMGAFAENVWPVTGLYGASGLDGQSFAAKLLEDGAYQALFEGIEDGETK